MKNLYSTLFLLSFGLITNLPAQTLKNIHRHNMPVLQIPVDLIDKVETIDVDGVKTLRVTPLFGETTQIPTSEIDSITHYIGSVNPEQLGEMRTASVMGIVRDTANAPIMNAIVRSPYGGEETLTDPNGVFFLNNIIVYDKLGYISIEKPGFHQGSRSFLPLETGSNRVNVQLLPMSQSGTFSAASGGSVTSGLLQLNFSANAITLNGQPYTGTVNVFAAALDPTSTEMFDQMPGELLGGMNDSLRLLRSFGMATIELRDENMNELQLAEGASATLTFNIPSALQADAPETIDWWSFDEALGYWKHEGEAQKQGNQYVGLASHFSWWNVDVPQNFNDFLGTALNDEENPISGAQINMATENLGTGITYTSAEGNFSGRVPKNQQLELSIYQSCLTANDWILSYTESVLSGNEAFEATYTLTPLELRYEISGSVLNCVGQNVSTGYVILGSQISPINEGIFSLSTCDTGFYNIRAFDLSDPDSLRFSDLVSIHVTTETTDAGSLIACSNTISGSLVDVDGNIYQTVLIGAQRWMAENLNTSFYSNGDPIANINSSNWQSLSIGAWTYYEDNPTYETTFGKLYNRLAVQDPRGLCPSGWHVPSLEELNILISYLGGSEIAGGKLKSISHWAEPNIGATNESGFSALPGGAIATFGVDGIPFNGHWWDNSALEVLMLNHSDSITHLIGNLFDLWGGTGASVRCVKD